MKKLLFLLFLLGLLVGPAAAQEDITASITHDDLERGFLIHLPPGYEEDQPAPLLLVLHGAGMTGPEMMVLAQFNALADESGHIVVYPGGVNRGWNAEAADNGPDDLGFLAAVLDHMEANYAIDGERVHVVGYSNGGTMALRVGCTFSERFAGVVAVAANFSFATASACLDAEPLSTLIVLGTRDHAFPWQGYAAVVDGEFVSAFSAAQTMQFLATRNGCEEEIPLATVSLDDSPLRVVRDSYTGCDNDVEIALYALIDGEHGWPHQPVVTLDDGSSGDMTGLIWQFVTQR